MINIYPVAHNSRKNKEGLTQIRIAIYANGQTRYIPSGIYLLDQSQLVDGNIVNHPDAKKLNDTLRRLINKTRFNIDILDYTDGLTAAEIVRLISPGETQKSLTLGVIYKEYISTARIKASTARLVENTYNTIERCLGKNFYVASLTYAHIMKYERALRNRGNCNGTIRTKMAIFAKIVKYAEKARYVKFDRNPFLDYSYPQESVRDAWLTTDQMRTLRDTDLTGRTARLRDYIMLSYYLGGINAIDLLKIDFHECRRTGFIKYVRTKTEHITKINKYISFKIPDEAWEIIDRRIHDDGFLGTPYDRYNNLHDFCSQSITSLREKTGLSNLIFYSARKSFSQHAFEMGINTGIIDYIIGHKLDKSGDSLYNYIVVTPDIATKALRQVLDNLK